MGAVCAIIVTYNPSRTLAQNVDALLPQVDGLVIVDNGSVDAARAIIEELGYSRGIKVVYNQENLGIATGLNIGVEYSLRSGYAWAATFDQDSFPSPDLISSMFAAFESCPAKDRVALISPCYVDKATGVQFEPRTVGNDPYTIIKSTMTSGNLIRLALYSIIGPFDDSLFIDYVDHEFCLRLRKCGFLVQLSNRSVLYHSLGRLTRHPLIGSTTNHSALRRYYIARNRVTVYRRYILFDPTWVLRDAWRFMIELTKVVLLEDQVLIKLKNTLQGLFHGVLGRLGKCRL